MFGFIKLITDLFKGWPFWFGGADEEIKDTYTVLYNPKKFKTDIIITKEVKQAFWQIVND